MKMTRKSWCGEIPKMKSFPAMKVLLTLMMLSTFLLVFYKNILLGEITRRVMLGTIWKEGYILYNSKCRIPDMLAFNPEVNQLYKKEQIVHCGKLGLLTYVRKNNDSTEATLHIDNGLVRTYSKAGVVCCISNVTRGGTSGNVDAKIRISKCEDFTDSVALPKIPVFVNCRNAKNRKNVYKDVHAPVIINNKVRETMSKSNRTQRVLSVLLVGFDSVSRLNSMRVLPITRNFLKENDWLEMKGYNKVADSTLPNLIAMLTGRNSTPIADKCDPTIYAMDLCNLLWYDYKREGYVTAYGEDHIQMGTFNFADKKGFLKEPTDYYFRPYFLATERLKKSYFDGLMYCTGPISCTERVLNAAEDFALTFKDVPSFGFFWINHPHESLNAGSRLDFITKNFLENLKHKGILENSIVLVFSDHGLRFGKILHTYTGWYEERLPLMYIWVPKWFRETFPLKYGNMRSNTNKLTTPYDVHMTLQDILVYSGTNHTIIQSKGCPTCKSLFYNLPNVRSCEEASIDLHWCACTGYTNIISDDPDVQDATEFSLESIQGIVSKSKEAKKCVKYSLKKIISSRISKPKKNWYKNDTYILIIFETQPSAIFEATVKLDSTSQQRFSMQGGISRLDKYKTHAFCVDSSYLKMYCYCK